MKLQSHHHVQQTKLFEFSDSIVHSALPPMWQVLLITYWAFVRLSSPYLKGRKHHKRKRICGEVYAPETL